MEINQVYSFKIRGFEPFQGLVRARGSSRTLVAYVPVDYILDGYRLILSDKILGTARDKRELQVEKILMLKNQLKKSSVDARLDDDFLLFEQFLVSKQLIQIYPKDESFSLLGQVENINRRSFNLKLLDSEGQWLAVHNFPFRKIKIVEIDTDYINSLNLLKEFNQLK